MFRLTYRLTCDESWQLREAEMTLATERSRLQIDNQGRWRHREDGSSPSLMAAWTSTSRQPRSPTASPYSREPMVVGERHQFRMAWFLTPGLTFHPQPQSYAQLADRLYLFESLDGTGFKAELPVDEDGIVMDYVDLFLR